MSDIADNSSQAHSTHTHASSTIHLPGKCPCGQMSFWANGFLGRCPSGQMSSGQMAFWANVLLGKRPSGQISSRQMSFWANVFLGKCLWENVRLGKCCMGKCRKGKCRVTENTMSHLELLWRCVSFPYPYIWGHKVYSLLGTWKGVRK
jgi:hypothetical protein